MAKGKLRKLLWPKSTGGKIVRVCIYGAIVYLILGGLGIVPLLAQGNPGFSARGKDLVTGAAIENTDISWTLKGLPKGEDKAVPGNFETLAAGTSLADLAENVNATSTADYDLYLDASATNVARPWRAYSSICMLLDPNNANVLEFCQTSTVDAILYQEDFTTITAANFSNTINNALDNNWNVDAVGNFSAVIGINASDIGYSAYKGQFDCSIGDTTQLYWIYNFNSTGVALTDLGVGESHWTRLGAKFNTTAIAFISGYMAGQDIVDFTWDDDVADTVKCIDVTLWYGTVDTIAAGTATKLAAIV